MQEESAVTEPDGTPAWSCPLCQQDQSSREVLACHLTRRHNVLPACLERLLDTATLVYRVKEENFGGETEKDMDTHTELDFSKNIAASTETVQDTATSLPLKESGVKVEEENEWVQETTEGRLKQEEEKFDISERSEIQKSLVDNDKHRTTRKNSRDFKVTEFLDPKRPFKCNVCLESFSSKSRLSIHYSSAAHLCRMRKEVSLQGKESDFSSVTSCPKSDPTLPYISSKPYQCAVCRVSYNHSITLESHLRSVLHQSRCRSAGNSAGSTSEISGMKGSRNSRTHASALKCPGSSASDSVQSESVAVSHLSAQGDPTASTSQFNSCKNQVLPHPDLSLSPPVPSTDATSAFLSLLTSGSQVLPPTIVPSLLATSTTSSPITALPQLISQQQLLLPLFLNSLQTQNQNPNTDAPGHVLAQPVSMLGLNAAQQVLLAHRACGLQSLGHTLGVASAPSTCTKEKVLKVGGSPEGVKETVKEKLGRAKMKLSPKDTVKLEDSVKERNTKGNGTVLSSTFKCENRDVAHSDVDDDKGQERTDDMDGESTVEGNDCEEKSKIKEWENNEEEHLSGKNPLIFQAALDKIPLETCCTPCSVSAPSDNSLSPVSSEFSLRLDSTPPKSHSAASSNLSPANSSAHNVGDSDAKHHLQSSDLVSDTAATSLQNHILTAADFRISSTNENPLALTEFQSQMLWAFFESRSQTDIASAPQEDFEALCKEVGLSEEEVRRWLGDARERRNDMATKLSSYKVVSNETRNGLDRAAAKVAEDKKSGFRPFVHGKCSMTGNPVMDLSNNEEEHVEDHGSSCQPSDSDSGDFYTAVIVTGEETENGVMHDAQDNPAKPGESVVEMVTDGGKVLRSSTVFLSDAEDENEQSTKKMVSKKRQHTEKKEVTNKRERLGSDVHLELEAQTDTSPSPSAEQDNIPKSTVCSSAPLTFAPVTTQFVNPYILPLSSFPVGLQISKSTAEPNKGKPPVLLSSLAALPFSGPLNMRAPAKHVPSSMSLSSSDDYESALDLSVGKNYSSKSASSTTVSTNDKAILQQNQLLEGLGLKPTGTGVPGTGGLILLQVKPNSTIGIHSSSMSGSNKAKRMYKHGEQVNASRQGKEQDNENDHESTKLKRLRARSRTIIQTEQLDVLYGCYFKDPNPGKHEFEQISAWVKLPKKVVQIWFQNMRARERKGEVRFIGNGTLAAVGKPLIKFTWPLSQPIFSNSGKGNLISPGGNKPSNKTSQTSSMDSCLKTPLVANLGKEKEAIANVETEGPCLKAEQTTKASISTPSVSLVETQPPHIPQKRKRNEEDQLDCDTEEITDDDVPKSKHTRPGSTSQMAPTLTCSKTPICEPQKHNGVKFWPTKDTLKITTFARDQLALPSLGSKSTKRATSHEVASSPRTQCNNLQQCTPRRPRTLLTNLQLSILQSCYEVCPHPNAAECEAVGTELKLPLKVIQIWFQNTRAKEKRWRLQQEKQSSGETSSSEKFDTSPSSYLQYSALRANRPILPKPIQLIVQEASPSTPPGQPAGQETVRGRCEVCGVNFESRAAGRVHIFSPQHLATLRATNFGQLPSHVSSSSSTKPCSGSGTGIAMETPASPNSPTS